MTFPAFVFGVVYPLLCGAITFSLALHVARQQHDIAAGFLFTFGLVFVLAGYYVFVTGVKR